MAANFMTEQNLQEARAKNAERRTWNRKAQPSYEAQIALGGALDAVDALLDEIAARGREEMRGVPSSDNAGSNPVGSTSVA